MTDQTPPDANEDRAKETARARHTMLSLLSFGAAFLAAGGGWLLSDNAPVDVPEGVAYAIIVAAIVIFFFGPNWLRKKWRKEDGR